MASFGLATVHLKVAAMFGRACGKNPSCSELSLDGCPGSKQEEIQEEDSTSLSKPSSSGALTHSPSDGEISTGMESGRSSFGASTEGSFESPYQQDLTVESSEGSEGSVSGEDSAEGEEEEDATEEVKQAEGGETEEAAEERKASPAAATASTSTVASAEAGASEDARRAAWKAADAAEKQAAARRRPNKAELTRVSVCVLELMGMEKQADECVERLLIRAIDLLYRCGFPVEDVCSVLAHASIYFADVLEFCGPRMEPREVGNILVVLMYLAHSYVMDEACPLQTWHSNLFRGYCTVGTLNAAAMKLLEVRGWVLRVDDEELTRRHELLMHASGQAAPVHA